MCLNYLVQEGRAKEDKFKRTRILCATSLLGVPITAGGGRCQEDGDGQNLRLNRCSAQAVGEPPPSCAFWSLLLEAPDPTHLLDPYQDRNVAQNHHLQMKIAAKKAEKAKIQVKKAVVCCTSY